MHPDFGAKRALLLQGPVGPFFRRLADELIGRGVAVTRVNFNSGDQLFFRGPEAVAFRESFTAWPAFFRALVQERGIDSIFLSGDCRPLHKQAIQIAEQLGIRVWVFEEGYLRPDHITVERGGVNGHSSMSKDPAFYLETSGDKPPLPPAFPVGSIFGPWAWYTTLYACALTFLGWRFPHYRHHRNNNAFREAFCWVLGFFRKIRYRFSERRIVGHARTAWSGAYYFLPLQVYCDSQLDHADFENIEQLIETVMEAFAEHADSGVRLIIKHHPHDRGHRDYTRLIKKLGQRLACRDRVIYVHDVHLPTLLKNARGTITMNSTVGLSSMYHGTPVNVLGRAVYHVPGLSSTLSLAEFLQDPGELDVQLYQAFCRWLRDNNQLNGSYYKALDVFGSRAGIQVPGTLPWPDPTDSKRVGTLSVGESN